MPAAEQVSGDNCFIDVQMWDGGIRRSDVLFLYPHPLPQSGKRNIFISTSHLSWFINMTGGMSVDAYANLSACWQKIGVFVTSVWVT